MGGIFGSSGKTANPAGTVGSLVGAIGAVHASRLVAEPSSAALDFARENKQRFLNELKRELKG